MENAISHHQAHKTPERGRTLLGAGAIVTAIGILMWAAYLFAALQSAQDRQPWFNKMAGQLPTLTEMAALGQTTDPYADRDYAFRAGPYQNQNIRRMSVPATHDNAEGVRNLIVRDALHRHSRASLNGLAPHEDEIHLWIDYRTVRLIRGLQEIDPHDQQSLNEWAAGVRHKPYDIDPARDRHRFQPTYSLLTNGQVP